ncbi:TolB domain-containing protein [Janthinobacterium sp. HH01]|uniref:PD40 domain-containing protein n=1 Tax=Janthinobacterium sp. HH01 TaxID=1198452 RepID=UPI0002AEAAB3|nr:PD40 domain-containing protein [Janthinobacterium sp. HH01]ELX11792.1 TolB domain-containing protein [Janthinobacterium sp. HH01]
MKKLTHWLFYTGLAVAAISGARAQMRVEICGVGSNQIPVAVAGFADELLAPQQISAIIKADLDRSGMFKVIDAGAIADVNNIDYAGWKAKGADALVVGTVSALADGRYDVRYKLFDTVKASQVSREDQSVPGQAARMAAHKIADDVFFRLTGVRGAFATRIAYVKQEGGRYQLVVADVDGEGEQAARSTSDAIISPAWSPDGSRLAVSLSKDGHTQIYTVNADGSGLRRVSDGTDDLSPSFAPNGKYIIYATEAAGLKSLAVVSVDGRVKQRLTAQDGDVRQPAWGPFLSK